MYLTRKVIACITIARRIILSVFVREDVKHGSAVCLHAREKDDVILVFIVKKVSDTKDYVAIT